jgi:alpha-ribazole phosphatase
MRSLNFPLILLRHGESEVPPGCCVGQLDIQLTDQARQDIEQLAQQWPCVLPTRIVCSDLSRTHCTASILATAMALPIKRDARLRELNFGTWEGRRWDSIYQEAPLLMDKWGQDWLNTAPPGGENVRQLAKRVSECFDEISHLPPEPTLIVAHAGSLRALHCYLNQRPLECLFEQDFRHGEPRLTS